MDTAKPRLALLRSMTDEHVLRTLMRRERATRAEIAAATGISKPTISDSVRRLTESGLLVDTGERTTGRGRIGSYYSLATDIGAALVVEIAPHGVAGEAVDAFGAVLARTSTPLDRDAGEARTAQVLAEVAGTLAGQVTGGLRTAVVSAADPVDRRTGALVHLPDAPFLVGELAPVPLLAPHVDGPVLVDNDVNWAARAEMAGGRATGVRDFVYLHLGEGLGCAVVSDGEVRRGHGGLAGEIAHLYTAGPGGRAMPFTEVFAGLGLRRPSSTAIDVAALRTAVTGAAAASPRAVLATAVCGALLAAISLVDPEIAVLGGDWGPDLVPDVAARLAGEARHVPVVAARVTDPHLTGARATAVERLRAAIVATTAVSATATPAR
ncbi:ROK family transcriptional regulator [Actinophytocola algeriensis]|uniref:Putative NBD/HSP70 family sugar kinase n=1 Tax=Actinophytocola algeriensis TaxID=1768010 RepID=A0A7W7Q7I3_9PSEU|nr:ROK family transcriptional regulator [Actinophytocola algeriensis]MBB4908480.1 putative NBD/HSP70 family sugar kinase [Actinophytocola algeriensis]MBE1475133.1 putative NBD/HSP70 family sugar kinase [Actinophytocola algeriensis]